MTDDSFSAPGSSVEASSVESASTDEILDKNAPDEGHVSSLEARRLKSLHTLQLLDTPPEEKFDSVTRLAAQMFEMPVAFITFIDENRQWFKSTYGLGPDFMCETPRTVAFCAHTIESKTPFIVPDARQNVIFADNPFVVDEPYVRFYAGVPLVTKDGLAMGSLALLDFVPRELSAEHEAMLVDLASVVVNILEERRASMEARGFERRLRTLVSSTSDIVTLLDAGGKILYESDAVWSILGYSTDDLLGKNAFDFVHPDDLPQVVPVFEKLVASGDSALPQIATFRFAHREGGWRVLEVVASSRLSDPDIAAIVVNSRDVTERHRVEAALQHSETLFKSAFELSAIGMALVGLDGTWLRVNLRLSEMLGYSAEELLALTFQDLTYPDDLISDLEQLALLLKGDIPFYQLEKRYFRKDGQLIWASLHVSLVRDTFGQPVHFISQVQDISARKQAEAELETNQARKAAILETALDGIITIDHEGKIVEWNPAAAQILQFSREEVMGRSLHDLVVPQEYHAAHQAGMARYLATGIGPVLGRRIELPAIRRDGERILVELAIVPVPGMSPPLFTGHMRDITARKQAEVALQEAKDEAERANQAKSEFLSRMSHELRTPLNAILGFGQLLELSELAPEDRQSVTQILKGGSHLLDLINEVLDIARIESGTLSISSEPVNLSTIVAEVIELLRPLAAEKNVQLRFEVEDDAQTASEGYFVVADHQRLKQVVLNLVSNAIKYNRRNGWVSIGCEIGRRTIKPDFAGDIDAQDIWRLRVRDSGWGLTTEKLARLFTPFDRLGAEGSGVDGTGIGLALSKRLVELMGGSLSAQSAQGQGCTFWVDLPKARRPARAPEVFMMPGTSLVGTRWLVLTIEDNLSNLELLQRVLAHRPEVKIISAIQGTLGLELARQHMPDLILLDLHLPEMPGEEVLSRLKHDASTRDIPVVVLSADATPGRIERLLQAGAHDFISKPFDIKHLLGVLSRVLAPLESEGDAKSESFPPVA